MPTGANEQRTTHAETRRDGRGNRSGARRRRQAARSVRQLEQVIRELESRISTLTSEGSIRATVAGASDQVGQAALRASNQAGVLVADVLTDVADRLRESATSITGAAQMGTSAVRRIGHEIERRPLMTVAVALGVGFLAGMASRREAA
ncbi:MAG: hypothetical protein IRZ09_00945 [Variibacter sp.]|nr:hypothetical protein [Variibacter sp.]